MLESIVTDFARIPGCRVLTTLDERISGGALPASIVRFPEASRAAGQASVDWTERSILERLAAECDWSLIIAPETSGVLLDRVRWVEGVGGRLLGPNSGAVAIATDKLECARVLRSSGVPSVGGMILNDDVCRQVAASWFPLVLKPLDGAGSEATFLVRSPDAFQDTVAQATCEFPNGRLLVQPYVTGTAASVSFLVGPGGELALRPAEQHLSSDGRLRYCGGRLPLDPALEERAVELGRNAVRAVAGLLGYVGVDLVLANCCPQEITLQSSGVSDPWLDHSVPPSMDVVVEINPRLTTSYAGLRHLARINLAERMIAAVQGCYEPIEWRMGIVGFSAGGQVAWGDPTCPEP